MIGNREPGFSEPEGRSSSLPSGGQGVTQRNLNHCRVWVLVQTVAVVLKAKRNSVSPRVCASFPRLLKNRVVVLYGGREKYKEETI